MDHLINFTTPTIAKRKEHSSSPVMRIRTKMQIRAEHSLKHQTQIPNAQPQNKEIFEKFKKLLQDIASGGAYKPCGRRSLNTLKNQSASNSPSRNSVRNRLLHTLGPDDSDTENTLYVKRKTKQRYIKTNELYRHSTISNIKGSKREFNDPYNMSQKLIKTSQCKLLPKNQNTTITESLMQNSLSARHNIRLCKEFSSKTPRSSTLYKNLSKERSINKETPRIFYQPATKKMRVKVSKKNLRSISNDLSGWKVEL
ncbi:unnamed protein product [Blepharisma stoltei]|uniref:Uncharacterized protein n=1 Tax=Blepharisma stoltei TaxID=1481888 RepID=A0AAU9J262_9CILI|nr:unnamed protein product [Blepharisma stoltei]